MLPGASQRPPPWRRVTRSGSTPKFRAAFSRASSSLRPLTQYRSSPSCRDPRRRQPHGGVSPPQGPQPYGKGSSLATPWPPAPRQPPPAPRQPPADLSGGNVGVVDGDEVRGDAVAPPELPGDAPVPGGGTRHRHARRGQPHGGGAGLPLALGDGSYGAGFPRPPRGPWGSPNVVHPLEPGAGVGGGAQAQVPPPDGGGRPPRQPLAPHVPLRLQQRLHHVLRPAARAPAVTPWRPTDTRQ